MLAARCKGKLAAAECAAFVMQTDVAIVRRLLAEVDEMRAISMLKNDFPVSEYEDISYILSALGVDGMIPETEDFVALVSILNHSKNLLGFFRRSDPEAWPNLKKHTEGIVFPQYVFERLDATFGRDGKIKDRASKTLAGIRTSLTSNKQSISKKLSGMLDTFHREGWLSADLSATLVNGRTVLPIDSVHKRKIAGLIHDESASGKTSYIEPAEVVELNNRQRELELEEQREIRRILRELTIEIAPYRDMLGSLQEMVVRFDFIRAKAMFAIETNAILPAVANEPGVQIHQGINPLLFMSFKKENKSVVPLSLELNEKNRIMLISGPNAGGKSVAMKTTLLLQYMLQCGLLPPCGGNSCFGIFDGFFLEMGDDQSIENDLSTYSSHLLNMKHIVKHAGAKSVVFIDEFGSGTEPAQGGAIAEALLNELINRQCYGVITTHYTNLKVFAAEHEGIDNGAMMINPDMKPAFIFQGGLPGNSYALEIASRIGLSTEIIEYARQKAGSEHTKFDTILRKALKDKRYYERKRIAVRQQEKRLEALGTEYETKLLALQREKRKILDDARGKAEKIIKDINADIEKTIRAIKEANAEKEKTRELRRELKEKTDALVELTSNEPADSEIEKELRQLAARKPEIVEIDPDEIHIGSRVRISGHDSIGEVADLGDENAVVRFDNIITSIAKTKLEKVPDPEAIKMPKAIHYSSAYKNINELRNNFKPYTDIRGMTADEALGEITAFIDDAIVLGISQVKILHGKGNGILRKSIREYLKTIKQVQYFADEDIRFGGDGITVVQLK
ncbi:MAG TPA: Smr/MutS family protein [Bacteroidales bacterium]|mgnify:CR=1 FL=1|nr:Smr/MutS family protein [Bacteroidales bacterium]